MLANIESRILALFEYRPVASLARLIGAHPDPSCTSAYRLALTHLRDQPAADRSRHTRLQRQRRADTA